MERPLLLLLNVVASIAVGLGISYYGAGLLDTPKEPVTKAASATKTETAQKKVALHSPLASKPRLQDTPPSTSPSPTIVTATEDSTKPTPTPAQATVKLSTTQSPTPTIHTSAPTPTSTPAQKNPTPTPSKNEEEHTPERSIIGDVHAAAAATVKSTTRGKVELPSSSL